VDAVVIGAIGTMIVGVVTGFASWHGQRSSARANHTGVVMTGYGGLVDNLQEERDKLQAQVTEKTEQLAAAYAELARERAEKAGLQAQITTLTTERQQLLDRLAALGGDTQ
jgi:Tfp pilus assembly protein FimV